MTSRANADRRDPERRERESFCSRVKQTEFLDKHYHYFTRYIQPQDFYTWLRTKNVLSFSDQEEIDAKYITTYLKAGHLIDKVRNRGRPGFVAFMEVIEYSYPELFEYTTGEKPRSPPQEYDPPPGGFSRIRSTVRRKGTTGGRANTPSMEASVMMAQIATKLVASNNNKRLEVEELSESFSLLKKQYDEEEAEKNLLCDELDLAREKINLLTSEQQENTKKLFEIKQEKVELEKDFEELQRVKEQQLAELTELRMKQDSIGSKMFESAMLERQKSVTQRPNSQEMESLRVQNQKLQEQLDICKAQHKDQKEKGAESKWALSELNELRKKLSDSDARCNALTAEHEMTKETLRLFEEQKNGLQQSNVRWSTTIDQLKHENIKMMERYQELEAKYNDIEKTKDQLEQENKGFKERFLDFEECNRKLRQEIDEQANQFRDRLKPVDAPRLGHHPPLRRTSESPAAHENEDLFQDFDYSAPADDANRCHSLDSPMQSSAGCMRRRNGYRANKNPNSTGTELRRHGSASLINRPLVLFLPNSIEKAGFELLQSGQAFKQCQYEIIETKEELDNRSQNFEIIHHEKCSNGPGYQCLLTEHLKTALRAFDRPLLLNPMPVYCVRRMRQVNFNPIAVFVKTTSSGVAELSEEEEHLERTSVHCEVIMVPDDIKNNIQAVVELVTRELEQIATRCEP